MLHLIFEARLPRNDPETSVPLRRVINSNYNEASGRGFELTLLQPSCAYTGVDRVDGLVEQLNSRRGYRQVDPGNSPLFPAVCGDPRYRQRPSPSHSQSLPTI